MMRKRKIGLRGPTHYTIDCHDFADDTVCGDTLAGCVSRKGQVSMILGPYAGALTPPPRMDEPETKMPPGGDRR